MRETKTGRTRRKESRPGEILEAAFEEFVEKGFAAARVEDIAERVGVTKGTVYVYFKDKEALFDQMGRHMAGRLFTAMSAVELDESVSCKEKLRAYLTEFYRLIVHDRTSREVLRLMLAEGRRFPDMADRHYTEFFEPINQRVRAILKDGIARGEFRETGAVEMPEIVFGPSLLVTLWFLMFQGRRNFDEERFRAADIDLLLHGLCK